MSTGGLEEQLEENVPSDDDVSTLEELEELVAEDPELALELIAALPPKLRDDPDLLLLEAEAHAAGERWQEVVRVLERALEKSPEDSDVHHLLGVAYGELEQLDRCRHHFRATHALDARVRADIQIDDRTAESIAETARAVLDELPKDYRARLGNVLVVLEERPSLDLVDEGFDPRAYGLFEGQEHAEQLNQELTTQATRIVLYSTNLALDFPDPEDLAEEVRITVLHEVGHYFGLDEDDMVRLGLD